MNIHDEVNAKMRNDIPSQSTTGNLGGYALQGEPSYRPLSMREMAEKQAAHHDEENTKYQHIAVFLALHPEFDEFIQLVRSGAIQF